jgi:hypothetical protein
LAQPSNPPVVSQISDVSERINLYSLTQRPKRCRIRLPQFQELARRFQSNETAAAQQAAHTSSAETNRENNSTNREIFGGIRELFRNGDNDWSV